MQFLFEPFPFEQLPRPIRHKILFYCSLRERAVFAASSKQNNDLFKKNLDLEFLRLFEVSPPEQHTKYTEAERNYSLKRLELYNKKYPDEQAGEERYKKVPFPKKDEKTETVKNHQKSRYMMREYSPKIPISFEELPHPVRYQIFSYCSLQDQVQFSVCSKNSNEIFQRNLDTALWLHFGIEKPQKHTVQTKAKRNCLLKLLELYNTTYPNEETDKEHYQCIALNSETISNNNKFKETMIKNNQKSSYMMREFLTNKLTPLQQYLLIRPQIKEFFGKKINRHQIGEETFSTEWGTQIKRPCLIVVSQIPTVYEKLKHNDIPYTLRYTSGELPQPYLCVEMDILFHKLFFKHFKSYKKVEKENVYTICLLANKNQKEAIDEILDENLEQYAKDQKILKKSKDNDSVDKKSSCTLF